jgi:hypothetical protein
MRALVSCLAGCLPARISVLSRSRSSSLSLTTYLFSAICFVVTKHLRRCGDSESEICRRTNDRGLLDAAAQQVPTQFPGTNLIRVDVDPLDNDPTIYEFAVASFTARGTVVEFSDYTNSLGTGGGGDQGVVYTGALLANELAWYTRMASHFKDNPSVWLGTNNEPAEVGRL